MNKTTIIKFGLKELFLKLQNVSKGMRKRVEWVAEGMSVRTLKWNDKGHLSEQMLRINHKEVDNPELAALAEKLEFVHPIEFSSEKAKTFNFVYKIEVKSFSQLKGLNFIKIQKLCLFELKTEEIKEILEKIDSIGELTINRVTFEELDLSNMKINKLKLIHVKINGPLKLPETTKVLELSWYSRIDLIQCNNLTELSIDNCFFKEKDAKWLERKGKLEFAAFNMVFGDVFPFIPPSVRRLYYDRKANKDANSLKERFPKLIVGNFSLGIDAIEQLKLREASFEIEDNTDERVNSKLRIFKVYSENIEVVRKHPEILENVEHLYVWSDQFNFDLAPKGLKYLFINHFEVES